MRFQRRNPKANVARRGVDGSDLSITSSARPPAVPHPGEPVPVDRGPDARSGVSEPLAPQLVDDFVDHALQGDTKAAVALAVALLEDGVTEPRIITDLLAEAQRTVGERWERNDLTVADEHLVTVSTESALHALAGAADAPVTTGHVLVACAEGDWHAIAATMFAQQLRSTGPRVTLLGASTPPRDVAALLVRHPADALVVTCSVPAFFMGVTRLVDAAHALGTPVLVGGRALPGSTDRAVRLGADAGASDLTDAVRVLSSWRQQPPLVRREPTSLPPSALDLDAHAQALADTAFDTMRLRFPDLSGDDHDGQLAPGRDDLHAVVQYLAAAHLVRDETVFTDFLDWLAPVLRTRGIPDFWLIAGLETLLPHVSTPHPTAARLLSAGIERLAPTTVGDPADDTSDDEVVARQVVGPDLLGAERAWVEALRAGDPVSAQQASRQGPPVKLGPVEGAWRTSPGPGRGLPGDDGDDLDDDVHLVLARQREEAAEAVRAKQRDLLFRQVAALLATGSTNLGDTLQAVAELATTAVGDGVLLQTFSEGASESMSLTTAHRTVTGRARLSAWANEAKAPAGEGYELLMRPLTGDRPQRGQIVRGDTSLPSWSWGNRYIRSPVSWQGEVRGMLYIFRGAGRPDYDAADLDLLWIVTQRLGMLLQSERGAAQARQLTAELQQVNADQSRLLVELDNSEARERNNLAQAVHDDPLQLAVAALLRLDLYRDQLPTPEPGVGATDDIDHLDAITTILASCVDHLRTHLGTLTPPDMSSGLTVALRILAEATFVGTRVRVETRGPDHLALALSDKETVYRILREALVNVRKHARAGTVLLEAFEDNQTVTLRLSDDGVGLADASTAAISGTVFGHMGMSSMRARAAAVNAQFTLGPREGGGTVVELIVPATRTEKSPH